jgi:two-component system response regulator
MQLDPELPAMQRRIKGENRSSPRKRLLKGGVIAFSARHATLPCVVRDISKTGARLQVEQAAVVPDTFELVVELDGLEVGCAVVWRHAKEIGVSFNSDPAWVAPKRAQVVSAVSPTARPSLRRSQPDPVQARPAGSASWQAPATEAAGLKPSRSAAPVASIPILIADDDPDDRLLIQDAFRESDFQHPIAFVDNGEELLRYLRGEGRHAGRELPGLILLDLNMPRMDGRTALMHLKTDSRFKRIPVIVLTTSSADDDIQRTYDLGVSAFISKPGSFDDLKELIQTLNLHWMRFVSLPAA